MKNLLEKSIKPLTVFAFVIFVMSIPTYFLLVDWIWLKELDENNQLIAQRIENEFNNQHINELRLDESISFWNEIQSLGRIEPMPERLPVDSVYTIRRQNPYSEKTKTDRFRGLKTSIKINEKNYLLIVETNVEETEETVAYITVVTLLFFLLLVFGFWGLNKRISRKLWLPFQDTLQKLKSFELSNHSKIQFIETDIIEFHELNTALDRLLKHSISIYRSQKEFTENASHELQTPLAVIKSKLDLLLQNETLTNRQYQIVEEINRALTRITRINKNLLLLAKIENQQFNDNEKFDISRMALQCLEQLTEHYENKQISVQTDITDHVYIQGNKTLTEILIYNLLLNAIRHNEPGGEIIVSLNKDWLKISNSGKKALAEEKMFERFAVSSSESSNSGLGLAIIKQICVRHQWAITYEFTNSNMHLFFIHF